MHPVRNRVRGVIGHRAGWLTDVVISSIETLADGIVVDLGDRRIDLSWTWLRDHARDESSYLESAHQRLVPVATVAAAGPAERIELAPGGDAVEVAWANGPITRFDESVLRGLGPASRLTSVATTPEPWAADQLRSRHATVAYRDVLVTDGLADALTRFWRDGVVVVADVPLDVEATRAVIERFGYIRTTIFGGLWEYGSDGAYDDTASTSLEITPHTDGTYSHDAPGLLALHCHRYDAVGAENVFVDGHTLAGRLSPDARAVLSTVEIPGRYIGDGAHLVARRPVLRYDGDDLVQVSYNHHDRAPFVLPEPEMTRLYAALHEFDRLANRSELQFEVALRPGDMVLFDNWRVLHGRRAFTGDRWIAGAYVNREDVESTTRLLGL